MSRGTVPPRVEHIPVRSAGNHRGLATRLEIGVFRNGVTLQLQWQSAVDGQWRPIGLSVALKPAELRDLATQLDSLAGPAESE